MNGNIDQFREDLRSNILGMVASFDRFNALIHQRTQNTEQELRNRLAKMDEIAELNRAKTLAAYAESNRCLEEEKLEASEKITEWKKKRLTSQLHARADRLERCAVSAVEIAVLAMDEAERTVLRAILSRKEAVLIQVQRSDGG